MAINIIPTNRFNPGWPVTNYAQQERNLRGLGRGEAISIPRYKYTYLVEFQINPRVLSEPPFITNFRDFLVNGRIYTHLKTIDHPKPTIKHEKLRSYNKWITIPTVMEYPTAGMTFHDDATSIVQALWKEHTHFYSHVATVGEDISASGSIINLQGNEVDSYQYTDELVGEEMRRKMDVRPSLGMKLKADDMRHFFESIIIYDLGSETTGINVYWYHRPMITSWDHDGLDKEARNDFVNVNAQFEYESYYWSLGQTRGDTRDYIEQILEFLPQKGENEGNRDGVAHLNRAPNLDRSVDLTSIGNSAPSNILNNLADEAAIAFPLGEDNPPILNPIVDNFPKIDPMSLLEISTGAETSVIPSSLTELQNDLDLTEKLISTGGTPVASVSALKARAGQLTSAINNKQNLVSNVLNTTSEKSALENTMNNFNASEPTVSGVVPNAKHLKVIEGWKRLKVKNDANIVNVDNHLATVMDQARSLLKSGESTTSNKMQGLASKRKFLLEARKQLVEVQTAVTKHLQ